MQNFLGRGSKCDIVPSLLCYEAGVEVNHFTSDDELFKLASRVLRSFLLTMKSSEQNHIQMLCVCLCLLRRRCSRLRVLFTTRNVVLFFFFWAELWTTAFKTSNLYMWLKFEYNGGEVESRDFSSWSNFVIDLEFTV